MHAGVAQSEIFKKFIFIFILLKKKFFTFFFIFLHKIVVECVINKEFGIFCQVGQLCLPFQLIFCDCLGQNENDIKQIYSE